MESPAPRASPAKGVRAPACVSGASDLYAARESRDRVPRAEGLQRRTGCLPTRPRVLFLFRPLSEALCFVVSA